MKTYEEIATEIAEAAAEESLDSEGVVTFDRKKLAASITKALLEANAQLIAERDEARKNYQFMVERACDEKLDGYRELAAKCAELEEQLETERAMHLITVNERDKAEAKLEKRTKEKNGAYDERHQVVAAFCKAMIALGYSAGLGDHVDLPGEPPWEDEWRNVVYIDTPRGQVSWHFHSDCISFFEDLPRYSGTWDGHDTAEKYRRLGQMKLMEIEYKPLKED